MSKFGKHRVPQGKLTRRSRPVVPLRSWRRFAHGKRARGWERSDTLFLPPEDWHETDGQRRSRGYQVIVQDPGRGFRHAVTADDVRRRLARFPGHMLEALDVVQFSRMTRKKRTAPCYGMQWGSALYLYPIEETLVEEFSRPPLSAERREAEMYGGRWEHVDGGDWRLVWTPATIRSFFLNNILIHELGHLLDDRNRSYADRERFADWFAIEYGYKSIRRGANSGRDPPRIVRRHGRKR